MGKTYVIAEAGVNHNGSIELAKRLIDAAAGAGADAVKFQTFRADKIVCATTKKAEYQVIATGSEETQFAMIRKLELDEKAHEELVAYCDNCGIQFLSTPFDIDSANLLCNHFNLPRIKISSGEITNAPLLFHIALTGKPVILSTGMSSLSDIETALSVLAYGYNPKGQPSLEAFQQAYISPEGRQALERNVTVLHCTTEYPAPFEDVNLRAMNTLSAAFGLPVGFSDHTEGIAVPVAAVALGAVVIEKHLTINRDLPGPDHKASLEPGEFKLMVDSIRKVEKSLGTAVKAAASSEIKNLPIARKFLVAARDVKKDEIFTPENLTAKRCGGGVSPVRYWEWLGRSADRDYYKDEQVGV